MEVFRYFYLQNKNGSTSLLERNDSNHNKTLNLSRQILGNALILQWKTVPVVYFTLSDDLINICKILILLIS